MPDFNLDTTIEEQPFDPQQLLRLKGPRFGLGSMEKMLADPSSHSPVKPQTVTSPVQTNPKTGLGLSSGSAVAGSEHHNPDISQDARSQGSGSEQPESVPMGTGDAKSGGMGSFDATQLLGQPGGSDPKLGEPDRQPTLPPAGGAGKGGDFTQADPVTGKPAGSAPDEESGLWKKLDELNKVDPAAQAKADMPAQPQELNAGKMGYLGPLLALMLGGPFAFEGAAEGVTGAVAKRHGEVMDYNKELSRLTAEYRKTKDVNVRAELADKIKYIHDKQAAELGRGKLQLQQVHEEHLQAHWQAMTDLGKLKLDMNTATAAAHNQVLRDIAELRQTENAREFDAKLEILKQHQADFHLQVASQIKERARANDIRDGMRAIAENRMGIEGAKAFTGNLKSIIDSINSTISGLERAKSNLRQNDPRVAQIDKEIKDLQTHQKELQGQFDTASKQLQTMPQGVVPQAMNPNDQVNGKSLADWKKFAQTAKNKPDASRLKQMGFNDAQIQYILAP